MTEETQVPEVIVVEEPIREATVAEKNAAVLAKITDPDIHAVMVAMGEGVDLTNVAETCSKIAHVLNMYAGTWFDNGFGFVGFINTQAHNMVAGAIRMHAIFDAKKAEAEAAALVPAPAQE